MVTGELVVEEVVDTYYETSYLAMYDNSKSFTFEEYYKLLENYGWGTISNYSGNKVQTDTDGIKFVELTKNLDGVGYDLLYYFIPDQYDEDGTLVSSSGNFVFCYNDFSANSISDDSWFNEDIETINDVTTINLPFIKVGETYGVNYLNKNALKIIDTYTKDLSKDYADLLVKDGFVLDDKESKEYNAYILYKNLSDGTKIGAMLYYLNGNNFIIRYIPKSYNEWPTEIVNEIKEKTGVEIPKFDIAEGGLYSAYLKNGVYYIESETLADGVDPYSYTTLLEENGLSMNSSNWEYENWEETISVAVNNIYGESWFDVVGMEVVIKINESSNLFSDVWPIDDISSAIKSLGIDGVNLPTFDNSCLVSDKKMKYTLPDDEYYQSQYDYYYEDIKFFPEYYGLSSDATDEEIAALAKKLALNDIGITVKIFDQDFAVYESYEKILENAGWYLYYDDYGNSVYEDPNGVLAVTLSGYDEGTGGLTTFFIHKGNGVEHSSEFYFEYDEYELTIGKTNEINLIRRMLPYKVSYSSDTEGITIDEEGNVEIAEDVEEGTVATITAKLVDSNGKEYTASCKITAIHQLDYEMDTALEAVRKLVEDNGYTVSNYVSDGTSQSFDVNFGTSLSTDEVKDLVQYSFIPEGFEMVGYWFPSTFEEKYSCELLDYDFYYDGSQKILIEFDVYTNDNNEVVLHVFTGEY